jgi:benzoyl-CoA reductase/2-hydroxyglutaryl-CoA dehydratase subunit BcrC/BadD/HgdB
MTNRIGNPIVHLFYTLSYREIGINLIKDKTTIYDIVCGYGFLRETVDKYGGRYLGIDSNKNGYQYYKNIYPDDNYSYGLFPDDNKVTQQDLANGLIICLTTLDEITDKNKFLKGIKNLSTANTSIYIAVRNKNRIFNTKKKIKDIHGNPISDESLEEYISRFQSNGFKVLKITKHIRPLITSIDGSILKQIAIYLFSIFFPLNKTYMLGFSLKV